MTIAPFTPAPCLPAPGHFVHFVRSRCQPTSHSAHRTPLCPGAQLSSPKQEGAQLGFALPPAHASLFGHGQAEIFGSLFLTARGPISITSVVLAAADAL
tara:strand:+ start:154 stop:450 length:297 start_codon:yes stop_codon:yes gene_type:complete